MKFTAFNGSPAGRDSATGRILAAFLRGAEQAGAETALCHLADYRIEQCRGCFACWFQTPGRCVIHDEMEPLLRAYLASDVVCFGSPVYSWNMTALLKNFVDRLIPLKSPRLVQEDGNFDMADGIKRPKRCVAVSNCGFPGENNFSIIRAAFSCCDPCLEIYRNCGRLLKTKDPSVQPAVEAYLEAVRQAGFELASAGGVSEAARRQLEAPLMSTEEYIRFLGMGTL